MSSLGHDVLCVVFSFLDVFDLIRCSAVCSHWNRIIHKSQLLEDLFQRKYGNALVSPNPAGIPRRCLWEHLQDMALAQHRRALTGGCATIDQWKGHSAGASKCRMRMGLIVTGGSDRVMRLWSAGTYKCLEEYSIPDAGSLVDFDFDENKIVGLLGAHLCIWRRTGTRSLFPSREGSFARGLCMSYIDPEAMVGCEDGTVRVFDMYSKKCTRIIRMHPCPVTCLTLSEEQLIFSGSSLGSITISGLSSDERVAKLRSTDLTGIKTLCYNPISNTLFAGSTAGYASCWDLRRMAVLWETRVSPNVVYSLGHLIKDRSSLVVGGIDGVLRVLDQNTGEVISSYVMEEGTVSSASSKSISRRRGRRLLEDDHLDSIPKTARPSITCLAVGMNKAVTTHNGKYIRISSHNVSKGLRPRRQDGAVVYRQVKTVQEHRERSNHKKWTMGICSMEYPFVIIP
ncbi:hypothetical protein MLD38_038244 [Melastoma candidum]|uniref:Uncharacterized protein n=1 Tax=Melastoma candidum TaxID=119954 RepID=A0ACB9KYA7_9MYRT|nr:hypothetical protein MLD38_038244 [Melastoma candidum]